MITGQQAPKLIFNPLSDNITILLNHIVVTKDEPEEDLVIHQSIFTGHREFVIKGKYWIYECKVHLYKYTTLADSFTPIEKYQLLKDYEGQLFRFYRHREADYLKDVNGDEVQMVLQSITESYYKTTDYKDLLLLKFKSTKYVKLENYV